MRECNDGLSSTDIVVVDDTTASRGNNKSLVETTSSIAAISNNTYPPHRNITIATQHNDDDDMMLAVQTPLPPPPSGELTPSHAFVKMSRSKDCTMMLDNIDGDGGERVPTSPNDPTIKCFTFDEIIIATPSSRDDDGEQRRGVNEISNLNKVGCTMMLMEKRDDRIDDMVGTPLLIESEMDTVSATTNVLSEDTPIKNVTKEEEEAAALVEDTLSNCSSSIIVVVGNEKASVSQKIAAWERRIKEVPFDETPMRSPNNNNSGNSKKVVQKGNPNFATTITVVETDSAIELNGGVDQVEVATPPVLQMDKSVPTLELDKDGKDNAQTEADKTGKLNEETLKKLQEETDNIIETANNDEKVMQSEKEDGMTENQQRLLLASQKGPTEEHEEVVDLLGESIVDAPHELSTHVEDMNAGMNVIQCACIVTINMDTTHEIKQGHRTPMPSLSLLDQEENMPTTNRMLINTTNKNDPSDFLAVVRPNLSLSPTDEQCDVNSNCAPKDSSVVNTVTKREDQIAEVDAGIKAHGICGSFVADDICQNLTSICAPLRRHHHHHGNKANMEE